MPFYEYKKHRQQFTGNLIDPDFIHHAQGNMLYDPENKTYICYIPVETKRDFYIPDTLKELTKQEFLDRSLKICRMGVIGDINSPMTESEVLQWANQIWSDFENEDNS